MAVVKCRSKLIARFCWSQSRTVLVIMFEEAIKDAEAKEAAFIANGYKVPQTGPYPALLYGLPMSVKVGW